MLGEANHDKEISFAYLIVPRTGNESSLAVEVEVGWQPSVFSRWDDVLIAMLYRLIGSVESRLKGCRER